MKGTPEAVVRQWVGHVDREVMKLYTHIADEISQSAMQRLDMSTDGFLSWEDRGNVGETVAPSAQKQHTGEKEANHGDANQNGTAG